jgi:hypothetical protein
MAASRALPPVSIVLTACLLLLTANAAWRWRDQAVIENVVIEKAVVGRGTIAGRVALLPSRQPDTAVVYAVPSSRDPRRYLPETTPGSGGFFRFADLEADDYRIVAVVPAEYGACVYELSATVRDGSFGLVDATAPPTIPSSFVHCGNCGFHCSQDDTAPCGGYCE